MRWAPVPIRDKSPLLVRQVAARRRIAPRNPSIRPVPTISRPSMATGRKQPPMVLSIRADHIVEHRVVVAIGVHVQELVLGACRSEVWEELSVPNSSLAFRGALLGRSLVVFKCAIAVHLVGCWFAPVGRGGHEYSTATAPTPPPPEPDEAAVGQYERGEVRVSALVVAENLPWIRPISVRVVRPRHVG